MDAAKVRSLMALIPERTPRFQTGVTFTLEHAQTRHPDRLAYISRLLHWMSPLQELTREDQQALGLLTAAGRPVHSADLEDDGEDAEPGAAPEAAAPAPGLPPEPETQAAAAAQEPALA